MIINRFVFISGAALSLFAVVIGAFGAHALESLLLENNRISTFETASHYHFFHALALLFIAVLNPPKELATLLTWAALSFFVGVLIFSGSLYLLAITNTAFLGAITPIGGVFFLIGWSLLIRVGALWPLKS